MVNKEKMASVESTRDDVLTSEVDLLNKLDHPNILKIHEVIDTKTKMFIFLELVRDGDLYDKLKREGECRAVPCVRTGGKYRKNNVGAGQNSGTASELSLTGHPGMTD